MKVKKGTFFKNEHMRICDDNMCISKEFAKFLVKDNKLELTVGRNGFIYTGHDITYGFGRYGMSIWLKEIDYEYPYIVCGGSGSYGFNGLEHKVTTQLGVRTQRKTFQYIYDYYFKTKLIRLEKLKRTLNDG